MLAVLLALSVPAPPTLTPEETATVSARGIVQRHEVVDGVDTLVAVIDVAAPPHVVLDAVLDLPARAHDIESLDRVTIYLREPTRIGAHYQASSMGVGIDFHVIYTVDRAAGFARYDLDETKDNDISSSTGSYHAVPIAGGTRLVYRAVVAAGGWTPSWLRRWVVGKDLPQQLEGMRRRAEAG